MKVLGESWTSFIVNNNDDVERKWKVGAGRKLLLTLAVSTGRLVLLLLTPLWPDCQTLVGRPGQVKATDGVYYLELQPAS